MIQFITAGSKDTLEADIEARESEIQLFLEIARWKACASVIWSPPLQNHHTHIQILIVHTKKCDQTYRGPYDSWRDSEQELSLSKGDSMNNPKQ